MTIRGDTQTSRRRAIHVFWIGLAVLTVFRAWFNGVVPLTGEEAYYWSWSRHLDLCYFDHPPLVAWVIRLCTAVLGTSVGAVRAPALLCHTATAVVVCHCAWRITRDAEAAAWAGACFATAIFFGVTATMIIPDAVLFLCWALTVWLAVEAMQAGRQKLWPLAGVALGLSGLAKFHGVLLALSIGLFVVLSRRQRRLIRSGWFMLGVVIAGAMTLPVFVWNAREGWPTFAFQLARRHKSVWGSPVHVIEMLAAPFAYMGLVLFPLLVAGCVAGFRRGVREGREDLLFLAIACAGPFAFFLVPSVFVRIDPQWAAPAFLSAIPLGVMLGMRLARDGARRWRLDRVLRASVAVNGAVLAAAYGAVLAVVAFPGVVPRDIGVLGYRRQFQTKRLGRVYGWEEIGRRLRAEIETLGGDDRAFIYSRTGYGTASAACFYSGGRARTFIFDTPPEDGLQFFIWERKARVAGMNAVVISRKEKYVDLGFLRGYFERVERAEDLVIMGGGREQQRLFIARAWNLRGKPNQLMSPGR